MTNFLVHLLLLCYSLSLKKKYIGTYILSFDFKYTHLASESNTYHNNHNHFTFDDFRLRTLKFFQRIQCVYIYV